MTHFFMGNDKEIEQYLAGNFKEVTVDNGQDLVKVKHNFTNREGQKHI
ncbi:MAG: hypothetical protein M5Z89_17845 [Olivibacter sp.]|nr:hypothetical protein [Olivibacter sp. UJ_SKK_5.1]